MIVATAPGASAPRVFVVGLALASALVVQTAVFSRLPLPFTEPDLVLVVVVAVALATGPSGGMAAGFAAGLVGDLLSDHPAGIGALVLCLAGFCAGLLHDDDRPDVAGTLATIALLAAVTPVADAALLGILGSPRLDWADVLRATPVGVFYDAVLAPFVVPAIWALLRRAGGGPR